tara:strand:- start:394 stop:1056 length:663 start_codon:yes stop_codon:yes gene_type:complete
MQSITLKFHPLLRKYTRGLEEHVLNINDFNDLRSALESLFPALGKHIRQIKSGKNRRDNLALVNKNKRIISQQDYILNRLKSDDTEFMVVPLFFGGGDDMSIWQIIAGIALIVIGTLVFIYGDKQIGAMIIGMGISMLTSGIISMITAVDLPDETTDSQVRRDNKIFNGLQNTINSNTPIALIYGRTRVGGQFVSGEVRTYEHGRNETIKVSDVFPVGAS